MLDGKNYHRVVRRFVTIQREVATCAKVDNRFAQFRMVFNRSADDWGLLEWKEPFAKGEKYGPVLFGYREFEGRLIEVKQEASIVADIARMRSEGVPFKTIADQLNDT